MRAFTHFSWKRNWDPVNIRISLRSYSDVIRIAIQDNGCGIPEHLLSEVGKKGFTYGKGTQGNGLGLSYCKKIVEDWGGRFSIISREGQGTIVTIDLRT